MTEKLPELVSKKRVIVNSPSFYMVPRSAIGSDPDGVTSLQIQAVQPTKGFLQTIGQKLELFMTTQSN